MTTSVHDTGWLRTARQVRSLAWISLGSRLGSAATVGEGTQNYLCAAQAGAVLVGLAITAAGPAGAWVDPVIALGIAAWSVREGLESWRGDDRT